MTDLRKMLVAVALGLLLISQGLAENSISAAEAKKHIGESATVCGLVVGTHFAANSRGEPTFLNLDEPYPNQVFTIVIWGSDRPKFGNPESTYGTKHVCVSGAIESYRGVPQIVARGPGQIRVQEK